VASSTLLDSVFEEVPRQATKPIVSIVSNSCSSFVQPFYELLPGGTTLYLSHLGRNWQEGDFTDADAILTDAINTNTPYDGMFTLTNGTQIAVRCSQALRPSFRWRMATLTPRQGRVCSKGSARNAFCPNCAQELHTWGTIAQLHYGAYEITSNPIDYDLVFPLNIRLQYSEADDDVDFTDRNNEMSFGRTFAANVTVPSGSSLGQGTRNELFKSCL
jgi:hypothetical protein